MIKDIIWCCIALAIGIVSLLLAGDWLTFSLCALVGVYMIKDRIPLCKSYSNEKYMDIFSFVVIFSIFLFSVYNYFTSDYYLKLKFLVYSFIGLCLFLVYHFTDY